MDWDEIPAGWKFTGYMLTATIVDWLCWIWRSDVKPLPPVVPKGKP